jgi:hypothetical protein
MNPPAGTVPASPANAAPGLLRAARNAAIFLVALATVCAVIRAALPLPIGTGLSDKWFYFGKAKDRYDVLFVGSSRLYHGVIPPQFDARVKEVSGREMRSFNFACDAVWPPESLWLLRQILALEPARLRWVFLDCMDIVPQLDEHNIATQRTATWHDWRHTLMAWRAVAELPLPLREKWPLCTRHGTLLLRQWTNQGRGAEWLAVESGLAKKKKRPRGEPSKLWKDAEGYNAESDRPLAEPARAKFQLSVAAQKKGFPPAPIRPSFRTALAEIVAEVRAAGAEPILVLTPTVLAPENFRGLPENVAVWRYHDVNEYPALYEIENHFDRMHLNHAGAQIFTDLLATRFGELLKAQK